MSKQTIKLLTDAPNHNLALMKLSTYYKSLGHDVFLGQPMDYCDFSVGSWLFNVPYQTNIYGGVAVNPYQRLDIINPTIDSLKPDYSLYPNIDYSLGYTWEYCPRKCSFCFVSQMNMKKEHYSIHTFFNSSFNKICLLNNNTFSDPLWKETFDEIINNKLILIDENGYDLRLLDDEKLYYLNKVSFEGIVHFAFDRIEDKNIIIDKLKLLKSIKHPIHIYVLIGFPKWRTIDDTDIERCQIIADAGFDPFIMVYNRHIASKNIQKKILNSFQRMTNRVFTWRKIGFEKAWNQYCKQGRNYEQRTDNL